jgi:hypothetical protein
MKPSQGRQRWMRTKSNEMWMKLQPAVNKRAPLAINLTKASYNVVWVQNYFFGLTMWQKKQQAVLLTDPAHKPNPWSHHKAGKKRGWGPNLTKRGLNYSQQKTWRRPQCGLREKSHFCVKYMAREPKTKQYMYSGRHSTQYRMRWFCVWTAEELKKCQPYYKEDRWHWKRTSRSLHGLIKTGLTDPKKEEIIPVEIYY